MIIINCVFTDELDDLISKHFVHYFNVMLLNNVQFIKFRYLKEKQRIGTENVLPNIYA